MDESSIVTDTLSSADPRWEYHQNTGIYQYTHTMNLASGDYILELNFEAEVNYELSVSKISPDPVLKNTKLLVTKGFTSAIKVDGGKIKSCSSANKQIATVTNSGKVIGKKEGNTKVTVKLTNGKKLICNVSVKSNKYSGNEDPHGCIRVWFAPEYEETYIGDRLIRSILPGTYVAVYDPVGIDKDKKEITDRHSHNSIFVIEMPRERNGFKPKLCAAYYGRTERLEEADEKFYRLCKWYNCIGTGLVEINRGETVSNFRKWKATKYLGYEPLYVWDSAVKEKVSTSYGYNIGSGPKKLDGLRLLKEFLYEVIGKNEFGEDIYVFERFLDYQTILELKKFNAEGNFDRISSLILLGIYWKSIDIKGKRELASRKKVTEDNDKTDIFNRQWF